MSKRKTPINKENPLGWAELPRPSNYFDVWKTMLKNNIETLRSYGATSFDDLKQWDARVILDAALWKIPEFNLKYRGQYYSKGVWERSLKEGRLPTPNTGIWTKHSHSECIFEHVVERRPLINWLMEDPQRCDNIENVVVACIVLPQEEKKLPKNVSVDPTNVWARYKEAKIDVWDRKNNEWLLKFD